MSKYAFRGCRDDHAGKFNSCRDEALWQLSLDGADNQTGDTDTTGHYALMILKTPETAEISDGTITVPAGYYIVRTASSGQVTVDEYGNEDRRAYADFELSDARYGVVIAENEAEHNAAIISLLKAIHEWGQANPRTTLADVHKEMLAVLENA